MIPFRIGRLAFVEKKENLEITRLMTHATPPATFAILLG
jgi:hypothetical protein